MYDQTRALIEQHALTSIVIYNGRFCTTAQHRQLVKLLGFGVVLTPEESILTLISPTTSRMTGLIFNAA